MLQKSSLPHARSDAVDPRLKSLSTIATLNRKLFLNCLEGITDEQLAYREGEGSSTVGFIVCHLLDARGYVAQMVGGTVDNPLLLSLRSLESEKALAAYPTADNLRAAWKQVSDILAGRLELVAPSELDGPASDILPVQDRSRLAALAFFFQHESYHIGQLAYLRKRLTGRAMSYQ